MNIYPTILTDSIELAQEQVNLVSGQDKIKIIQVDIIDGYFADNLTITPMDLLDIRFSNLKIDFHLMTEEPLSFAEEIVDYKKYLPIRTVIAQIEKMSSQDDFIEFLVENDLKKGLSLNLYTPHQEIMDSIFKKLDVLQILSIEAGEQGRDFHDFSLGKIREVRNRAEKINPNLEIIVDGGVKLHNIEKVIQAGADSVGVGSALWQSDNIETTLERFCEYAK